MSLLTADLTPERAAQLARALRILLAEAAPLETPEFRAFEDAYWREHADRVTWMYAIQAGGDTGDVKIGVSKDPCERLTTLQTGSSEQLRGLAAWRAFPLEERLVHEHFDGLRTRGEWFFPLLPLRRFLKARGEHFAWVGDR